MIFNWKNWKVLASLLFVTFLLVAAYFLFIGPPEVAIPTGIFPVTPGEAAYNAKDYMKAAEQGNWKAQMYYAEKYYPSYACAVASKNGARDLWHAEGCDKQNYVESCFWYLLQMKSMAAAHVDVNHRTASCEHVTTEEKAAIDKRVADWERAHPAASTATLPKPQPDLH